MKKLLIILCSLGLALGLAHGQHSGPADGFGDGSGNMEGPIHEFPPLPDVDPEVLEEIIALREQVTAIRDELRESRETVLADLGPDATREDRVAALTLWKEENALTFEEMRTLTEELRQLIQENRPVGPVIEIPDEIIALRGEVRDRRMVLAQSRRQAILALGENPTDEAIREAIEAWREQNAAEIQAVQALALQVRNWFRENPPNRPGAFETPRMTQRRAEFRESIRTLHQNRQQLRAQMQDPNLTDEERHQMIQAFREQQRDLMRDRRMLKRQERLDQGGFGGDRRPAG